MEHQIKIWYELEVGGWMWEFYCEMNNNVSVFFPPLKPLGSPILKIMTYAAKEGGFQKHLIKAFPKYLVSYK